MANHQIDREGWKMEVGVADEVGAWRRICTGRAHIVAVAGLPAVAAFGEEDASCLRAAVARTFVRPKMPQKLLWSVSHGKQTPALVHTLELTCFSVF